MDDVVIVGGGIIGAATAYFLSKEGRKVKVIERDPTYKSASINWEDSRINIIDTPGHRDFAAEVERVLSMADF